MGWRLFIFYFNVFTKIGLRWWKNDGPWIRGCVGNLDSWAVTKAATSYKPLGHALDTVERRHCMKNKIWRCKTMKRVEVQASWRQKFWWLLQRTQGTWALLHLPIESERCRDVSQTTKCSPLLLQGENK